MSLGAYPEVKLDEARAKHAVFRAQVLNKSDPLAGKRGAQPVATFSEKPTFGAMADDYVATHEGSWRNMKHRWQWTQTLTQHCAAIRDKPVDQIATADVLAVLKPIWNKTPETASRLRGRMESVIDAARALGHIPEDKANPARWKGHLDKLLPKRAKLTQGHHAALDYNQLPDLMMKLAEIDTTASRALRFTILTAVRTGEALGAQWSEINFDTATWTLPPSRMKTGKEHQVPLSDAAISILRHQETERGKNPYIFGGRPQRSLSNMAMSMLLRRLGIDATTHGMRASFRMYAADVAHAPFEIAEAALAHAVGSAVVAAYQRSSMLERRRPLMSDWANYICPAANVVQLRTQAAE